MECQRGIDVANEINIANQQCPGEIILMIQVDPKHSQRLFTVEEGGSIRRTGAKRPEKADVSGFEDRETTSQGVQVASSHCKDKDTGSPKSLQKKHSLDLRPARTIWDFLPRNVLRKQFCVV